MDLYSDITLTLMVLMPQYIMLKILAFVNFETVAQVDYSEQYSIDQR